MRGGGAHYYKPQVVHFLVCCISPLSSLHIQEVIRVDGVSDKHELLGSVKFVRL